MRLAILGATGSVGTTAINAIRSGLIDCNVAALVSCTSPLDGLSSEFSSPALVAAGKSDEEIRSFIASSSPDIILNAVSGTAGLKYTLMAIEEGIDIALANKESLVMGGRLVMREAREKGVRLIPVDSEHSAIYSLMKGRFPRNLIITASGGPFLEREDLSRITVEEALAHPVWKMGKKITIDSATGANKGQEVIEAAMLFGFPPERIRVVVHRQSIVHSMIEMDDGAVYALLSRPDMTLPVVSALTGIDSGMDAVPPLSFESLDLSFRAWDDERFPMLSLAYEALRREGSYTIAYAAADETLVDRFLNHAISFCDIPRIARDVLDMDWSEEPLSFDMITATAERARRAAEALC